MKKRVLSGMQASGRLHLGNLVGALANWVRIQDQYECFYFVADWHALTSGYAEPGLIKESAMDLLVNFMAAGLDPEKATIFIQSMTPEHTELHLILSMITPLGWLERVPTYKEKREEIKDKDLSTYGFLGYPVLQSADILIYRADYVPVGVDQLPHLEITREIARRFNSLYNTEFMVEPDGLLTEFPKVPGVDGRKMSKSYGNAIYLSDPPDVAETKIRTMMTDPARKRRTDVGNPEICPVYHLHKIFSSQEEKDWVVKGCTTAGIGCIECKKVLFKNMRAVLEPIWEKRQELLKNPSSLLEMAREGSRKASAAARETLDGIKDALGWIR
ncbi:MAG: tryptophan--tRNA ligase [Actinomycetota bacterium]|nr:tryptophan--tRNA ligase [Actinomycetota bacterium]